MRIVNGRMVYETEHCYACDGKGKVAERRPCPMYRKAVNRQPGHKCPHCGARCKHSHQYLDTGRILPCRSCNGTGKRPETDCSNMPTGMFQLLPVKVYRSNRETSWNESHLGLGCVFSCVDYGRHQQMTDEELIEAVRSEARSVQACKVADRSGRVCDHVGIFTSSNGYSVRAVFDSPDDVANRAAHEPSEVAGRIIGAAVFEAGGNGTLAAAGYEPREE